MRKLKTKIRVGITIGDPSGIGPEITIKAVRKLWDLAKFVVIGDRGVLEKVPSAKSKIQNFNLIDLHNVSLRDFSFGVIKAEYGIASIEYLDEALELIKTQAIDCLVTCPVSKEAISKAGFDFVGHTEYLAARTNTKDFVMLLLNRDLKISLVTRHLPLKDVSSKINQKILCKTIVLTHSCLKRVFKISNPRIVVCGLNPHASDNGLIGNEENTLIKPALKKLRTRQRLNIDGPIPADTAIHKANMKRFDCVIAMYHDQALIPLKLFDNKSGVNFTIGLPFIRTSPLHGTAFDIARNLNLANPQSLIEAIRLAVRCTTNLKSG